MQGGFFVIRLRGHHLICLHFYSGEGYSREFVENLEGVLRRARNGEVIEMVDGADDICRACPTVRGDECVATPGVDAEIRTMDVEAAAHLGVKTGSHLLWEEVKNKVIKTSKDWLAAFCEGCGWREACDAKKKALGLA